MQYRYINSAYVNIHYLQLTKMKVLILLFSITFYSCNKEVIRPIEVDTTIVDSGMNPNKDLPIIIK